MGTVVGAEFVASEGCARRGCVTVGAPRARRAALSAFSLEACRRRRVQALLPQVLVGSWSAAFMYRRPLFVLFDEVYSLGGDRRRRWWR